MFVRVLSRSGMFALISCQLDDRSWGLLAARMTIWTNQREKEMTYRSCTGL